MNTALSIARRALDNGDLELAESSLRQWLHQSPADADALERLALVQARRGDLEAALPLLHAALGIDPDHRQALINLGAMLANLGRPDEACPWLERAVSLYPDRADGWGNLAVVLHQLQHYPAALAALERALALQTGDRRLQRLQALLLVELERPYEAISRLRQAASGDPDLWQELLDLGIRLHDLGLTDLGISALHQGLVGRPDDARAWLNHGALLSLQGRLEEALSSFAQAVALDPQGADAHLFLGIARLLTSHQSLGWDDFEWRERVDASMAPLVTPPGPRWRLEEQKEPVEHLLLIGEQGLGDVLQFVRYAPSFRPHARRISLCVQEPLLGLIARSGLADAVVSARQAVDHQGPWLPLLSSCHALDQPPTALATPTPYLMVGGERLEQWRRRLASGTQAPGAQASGTQELLVGLHWQGNPTAERRDSARGRSLPLALLEPLAGIPGLRLLSLQKGPGAEQLACCSFRSAFHPAQAAVDDAWDFLDTAAIASCCDLIVSADSGLVHLAGGLGLPVWLLLQRVPDWRWGLDGEDSHWYPSLRLFRQRRSGDWPELIARLVDRLQGEVPRLLAARNCKMLVPSD